jgi:hypothetical protein
MAPKNFLPGFYCAGQKMEVAKEKRCTDLRCKRGGDIAAIFDRL